VQPRTANSQPFQADSLMPEAATLSRRAPTRCGVVAMLWRGFFRSISLKVERDLGINAKLDNGVVLNLRFQLVHIDGPNIAERLFRLL
jgi:hypothetical protein